MRGRMCRGRRCFVLAAACCSHRSVSEPSLCWRCVAQDAASALAMRVLLAVKASEMEQAVGSLDRDSVDVLMKYIYRGFESPSEGSSGHLLAWHEKVGPAPFPSVLLCASSPHHSSV
ncbi:hypothetical protein HPB48_003055 [Haemaphysalis longicornis]|uniref:Actin-related protein 2/3 complex subunit 5 n=1 Tax=Haemaphysalis longicornis TaxID=44386 RepID=A0A9J6FDP6_HAELO|nr:hypothetical protein HPB48_003055 [Haemaphysalis longicornis]